MSSDSGTNLVRIGIFYDGNYFLHVSNYYNYVHERKSRISIAGLHEFIRYKVAEAEGETSDYRHCQIVDAHYFRGRLYAGDAIKKGNQLYNDRVFDDILMSQGVTTHYLPLKSNNTQKFEKGVDVWFALEAFEQTLHKRFNILVLIASDGDYVPLVRKINTLGTSVMLLSWDFEYTDDYGNLRTTRTSQDLLDSVTYPVSMHEIINNRVVKDKFIVNNLFVPQELRNNHSKMMEEPIEDGNGGHISTIMTLKSGFGFIKYPNNNLFFHYENLIGCDFSELEIGDKVRFNIAQNDMGDDIAIEVEPVA